ncbi:ABC transporter G family member 20-like [Symsagittifera roscoffensis]|uniref:ABC transporter G family member 20-like n=1 Tax=Symsagittifera roscoffensis TaxID=84072 RepID=UPI00307B52E7
MEKRPVAILCDNATIAYGRIKSGNPPVLNQLKVKVECGSIYGLLGPSGCGKTTLLKCILGSLQLQSGRITVFGKDSPSSDLDVVAVPGKDVGYMPQDLALHPNFTIKEILYFYGKINGMAGSDIRRRLSFLSELLDLPASYRMVEKLSGGQRRRVSFAAALVHDPKLLILDEPTVGVDPLLRAKIWRHLVDLSVNNETTILITTHYIEEARQANRVGLMRQGVLLSEGEPEHLIKEKGLANLEAVFLELCSNDNQNSSSSGEVSPAANDGVKLLVDNNGINSQGKESNSDAECSIISDQTQDFFNNQTLYLRLRRTLRQNTINPKHLVACILKDSIHLIRNKPLMVFQFLLPLIQISILLLAIGGNPEDVPVGVFNQDTSPNKTSLSVRYLSYLDKGNLLKLEYFDSDEGIETASHNAQIAAIVRFGKNYTKDLIKRGLDFQNTSIETALGGSVVISLDQTVLMTAMLLQQKFLEAYAEFGYSMIRDVSSNPSLTISPINFTKPFYGDEVKSFTDYMAPGVILQLTYAMSVSLTGIGAIIERKQGLVDRLSASGVTETVLMLSLMTVQCFIMTGQLCILFIMALLVFDTPFLGNLALAVWIAYMQGLSGLVFGLIASAVCTEETQAMQLTLGTFYPLMLLSGVIWPLDAIPYPLRYVSYALPPTLPAAAMRDVFLRGWGLAYKEVWAGVLVNIGFIVLFLTIAIVIRKILWYKR